MPPGSVRAQGYVSWRICAVSTACNGWSSQCVWTSNTKASSHIDDKTLLMWTGPRVPMSHTKHITGQGKEVRRKISILLMRSPKDASLLHTLGWTFRHAHRLHGWLGWATMLRTHAPKRHVQSGISTIKGTDKAGEIIPCAKITLHKTRLVHIESHNLQTRSHDPNFFSAKHTSIHRS